MSRRRTVRRVLAVTAALIGLYVLCGPLFPWWPIRPAYGAIPSPRAVVVARHVQRLDPAYRTVEAILDREEEFHGLAYRRPVTIMVLQEWWEPRWFTPWMNPRLKAFAYPTGDVVFIRPRQSVGTVAEYLTHELSHSLLQQHASWPAARVMDRQHWVLEGAALHIGGPRYLEHEQLVQRLSAARLTVDAERNDLFVDFPRHRPDLRYALYAEFTDFLIDEHGLARYRQFLHAYLADPADHPAIARRIFGAPTRDLFERYLAGLE